MRLNSFHISLVIHIECWLQYMQFLFVYVHISPFCYFCSFHRFLSLPLSLQRWIQREKEKNIEGEQLNGREKLCKYSHIISSEQLLLNEKELNIEMQRELHQSNKVKNCRSNTSKVFSDKQSIRYCRYSGASCELQLVVVRPLQSTPHQL